jgi:S1-C subfamily serine protease
VRVSVDGCGLAPEIGVAFAVADGVLVTTAHTLAGTGPVLADGRPATVLAVDRRADVALLALDSAPDARPLRPPQIDEPVTVVRIRRDQAERVPARITRTPVIKFTDKVKDTSVERAGAIIDIEVDPGDSGAPVIGADGRVVAMVFAVSTGAGGQSYAVSSAEIETLLAAARPASPDRGPC